MAVAYDTGNGSATGNSLDVRMATLTVANSPDRFAILTLHSCPNSGTASSVTIGGLSFSLVSTVNYSTSIGAALYVCYSPNIGTQTAVVALAHSTSFTFLCSVFNGVDQTAGYDLQFALSGSAASVLSTLSTSAADLVFCSMVVGGNQGDASVSFTGATQRSTITNGNSRVEHHTYNTAGAQQVASYAGPAGAAHMLQLLNIRAASSPAALAAHFSLALMGCGR